MLAVHAAARLLKEFAESVERAEAMPDGLFAKIKTMYDRLDCDRTYIHLGTILTDIAQAMEAVDEGSFKFTLLYEMKRKTHNLISHVFDQAVFLCTEHFDQVSADRTDALDRNECAEATEVSRIREHYKQKELKIIADCDAEAKALRAKAAAIFEAAAKVRPLTAACALPCSSFLTPASLA